MTGVEKAVAWVGIVGAVFTAGVAWDSLSNRIDKVNDKVGEIQKTLGSTPCTAILDRQLAAIDKGRADVRRALDGLSGQYGCEGTKNDWGAGANTTNADTAAMNATANHYRPRADTAKLGDALNAVDVQLSNKN